MSKFMIAYYGGERPSTKEEGMAHKGKWKEWIESLEDKVINSGTPLMSSKLITLDNVQDDKDSNSMNGFAIISAEDMDTAIEIAKNDPFLQMKGTIRISQMMEM